MGGLSTPRLFILSSDVIFAARVNQPEAATYPRQSVIYDTVTVGSHTAIKPGMTLMLGSTPGASDLGMQRVREVNGAGATPVGVWVGKSSRGKRPGELYIVDNAYVTVLWEYLPWAKVPFIDGAGDVFKDSDKEVEDNTEFPPPVANTGPSVAATIDAGTGKIIVAFDGSHSFATADGATITDYLWDLHDGALVSGTLTDASFVAEFDAGKRYVDLTVTDSNDKSHTAHRLVFARDPENDDSVEVEIESIRVTDGGQQMTVNVISEMPRSVYRENAPALLWDGEPTDPEDLDHMLFIGFTHDEPQGIQATRTGNLRNTKLNLLDVAAKFDTLPGFPQSLANDATRDTEALPEITWSYMVDPTLDKYLHYLLHWHTTLLDIADFTWSGTGDLYTFVLLASDGESLWDQIDRRARAFLPDFCLICDRLGRVMIVPDPQLRDPEDRTDVVQVEITDDDYSDIEYTVQIAPRIHWLRSSAVLSGTTTPIQTAFSIAPGDTPGQGVGESTQGEQLALSQAALNATNGHRYARQNAPISHVWLTLVQDESDYETTLPWREIEPALKQWVTLDLSVENAAQRGIFFSGQRALPLTLEIRFDNSRTAALPTVRLEVELETVGEPGTTVVKPGIPPVGDYTPPLVTVPPDMGLVEGVERLVLIGMNGHVHRTADFQTDSGSGGPTYDDVDLETGDLYSWVVDPFSPRYAPGATSGAINGWAVGETDIFRLTDLLGTPVATSVYTFDVATDMASFHWRTIQASFGAFFEAGVNPWLLCVSYYGDTDGHSGTWATHSLDGGVTWSEEVQISAEYSPYTPARFDATAVYTSPRTPGLAYTTGFIEVDEEGMPNWREENSGVPTARAPGATSNIDLVVEVGTNILVNQTRFLFLVPPVDAKKVWVHYEYVATKTRTDSPATASVDIDDQVTGAVGRVGDIDYTAPGYDATVTGSGDIEYTFSGADWPDDAVSYSIQCIINGATGEIASSEGQLVVTVTQIELDDGTIYVPSSAQAGMGFKTENWGADWIQSALIVPGDAQAGSIHFPWESNTDESLLYFGNASFEGFRQFRLQQSAFGAISDISPSDGTRSYGPNRYGFAIRALDSDRQHLLMCGIGNDTSSDPADDLHGIWYSGNGGATWSVVVAPVADSEAPAGLPAFEAAFSPDDPDTFFCWGAENYISYTDSGAAGLDDRSGNLSSFGSVYLIGIAGEPT